MMSKSEVVSSEEEEVNKTTESNRQGSGEELLGKQLPKESVSPELDEDSLLLAFGRQEAHKAVEWCQNNCHRSDIFECRLEDGTRLKEEGNAMVKNREWEEASEKYLAALYQVDFSIGQQWQLTNEHQYLLDNIKLTILNNLCLAYLHRDDPEKARKSADLALKSAATMDRLAKETDGLEPVRKETLGKVYYRRAKASYSLRDYERAYEDAKEALESCPSDTAVKRLMTEAYRMVKKEEERTNRMWKASAKKMFADNDAPKVTQGTGSIEKSEAKPEQQGWISWLLRCSMCPRRKRD